MVFPDKQYCIVTQAEAQLSRVPLYTFNNTLLYHHSGTYTSSHFSNQYAFSLCLFFSDLSQESFVRTSSVLIISPSGKRVAISCKKSYIRIGNSVSAKNVWNSSPNTDLCSKSKFSGLNSKVQSQFTSGVGPVTPISP